MSFKYENDTKLLMRYSIFFFNNSFQHIRFSAHHILTFCYIWILTNRLFSNKKIKIILSEYTVNLKGISELYKKDSGYYIEEGRLLFLCYTSWCSFFFFNNEPLLFLKLERHLHLKILITWFQRENFQKLNIYELL